METHNLPFSNEKLISLVAQALSNEFKDVQVKQNIFGRKHLSLYSARDVQTNEVVILLVKSFGVTGTNYSTDEFRAEVSGYDLISQSIPNHVPARFATIPLGESKGIIVYEFIRSHNVLKSDLPQCLDLFNKLHQDSIIHGDPDCVNILKSDIDDRIVLVDFAQTRRIDDLEILSILQEKEIASLTANIGNCAED